MLDHYTQTTATIGGDLAFLFPSQLDEEDKPKIPNLSAQNTSVSLKSHFAFSEVEKQEFSNPSTQQHTSAWFELSFHDEVEPRITEFADTQQEYLGSSFRDEEDLLDWDAAIITPPPRPSGTIRVKLKYKGRSKPFPIENFWEE